MRTRLWLSLWLAALAIVVVVMSPGTANLNRSPITTPVAATAHAPPFDPFAPSAAFAAIDMMRGQHRPDLEALKTSCDLARSPTGQAVLQKFNVIYAPQFGCGRSTAAKSFQLRI